MKFEVDVERLVDYGMPLNQYFLCQVIYQQNDKILNYYMEQFGKFITKEDFDKLFTDEYLGMHDEKRGYVFSNLFITKLFIDRFIEKPKVSKVNGEQVEDWIDIWYNLFPKGIKSGGYLVRSDKNGCANKMKKFIKKYPEFTKEIVLKATHDYLQYYRMKNWNFVSLAHYFIDKNGMSILAGQCELITDKLSSGKEVDLSISQYEIDNSQDFNDIFNANSMMDRL
jgi:hypothetical protein